MANRVRTAFLIAAGRVRATIVLIFCFPVLHCFGSLNPRRARPQPLQLEAPKPLPEKRIDIRSRPQAVQPASCRFLHDLPLELRRSIYEEALGRRQVRLFISESRDAKDAKKRRQFVGSRSFAQDTPQYANRRKPVPTPTPPTPTSIPLSIALLRVCRQIYVEAHQILCENNIFDVYSYELDRIMSCGLGESIARPYIRKLRVHYWYQTYAPRVLFDSEVPTTPFKQIAAMPGLTHLAFQFVELGGYTLGAPRPGSEYDPNEVLDSFWGRRLLGIHIPNLQHLEMTFYYRELPEEGVYPPEYPKWRVVERKFNELMVGEGAEERCQQFLKDWAESKRTGEDIL
ncbi:hypothetical protein C8F01DRAFT_1251922 [Mycena amicta]|nr:hypothetical protein C8F01DRAFT_1251922 [Mycena amicta]